MLYFRLAADTLNVDAISVECPEELKNRRNYARQSDGSMGAGWLNRNDLDSLERAKGLATYASAFAGERYIAVDEGPWCSPRYDVIRMFAVGDDVSKGFNGDMYPVGKVVHISGSLRVVTTQEGVIKRKFYRRGETGTWKETGGTWSLARGVYNERNPSF